MKLAFVFPGQGSQSVGMMQPYGDAPTLRATFQEASQALGQDLWQLATEGPAEAQAQTVNTQPLMLTAGIAVYRLWRERGGPEPVAIAGHSLGEYTALVAAGVLEFRDAVALVRLRAEAMQEAVPAGQGAMAAILGIDEAAVLAACAEAAQGEVVDAVNFNGPGQIVIAGHVAAVTRAVEAAKAKGAKRAVMLPVSAPFHCALMRPAGDRLRARLEMLALGRPRIAVIHNFDVQSHDDTPTIREALVRQASAPVRWTETIQAMVQRGVTHVYECGPGKVLAGLSRRIAGSLQGGALVDASSVEKALAEAT
jgi:[acyl-carrier-protein] S-malonyltransferase